MVFFDPIGWAERALRAPDMESAWAEAQQELIDFGVTESTFVFGQPTSPRPTPGIHRRFGTFIDDEWDRQVSSDPELASHDPIAKRFFVREQALLVQRGNDLYRSMSEEDQAFYRHYDAHGAKAGAVWPVHDRKTGMFHLIASWTKASERDYVDTITRYSTDIHIATTYLCEALRVKELVQLKPKLALSPRERECLLWVQAGRSTKQISERLTLCDATVHEYIASAMYKLDASNRIQASARATMLGLIRP